MADSSLSSSRLRRLPLVVLALLVGGGFALSGWIQSGGHLMAPLDDTFIHLHYAQRMAGGHFFSYSQGMGYSSGATSWLWVFLLTPLFLLGATGVKALGLSLLLCGLLFLLSGLFIHRLAHELAGPAAGFLVGLLFILNGHVAWGYLSGMETGLFTALILLALAGWRAWTEEESRGGRQVFLVALALLPITRPEGWVLWAVALGVTIVRGFQQPVTRRREVLSVLAAGLLGLVAVLVHRLKAGEWATTGWILKGLGDQPGFTSADKFSYFTSHIWAIVSHFYNNIQPDPLQAQWRGQWVRPFVPPFAAVLAVIGGGMGTIAEWRRGRVGPLTLAMLWWIAGVMAVSTAAAPFVHNQRYLIPWTPLMLLLAGVGLARLARLFDPNQKNLIWGVGLVWVLLAVAATGWWAVEYGRNASDIFHQHRRMSWIVEDTTSPGDRVALTDAGAIAYYTDRSVFDLVGLCSSAAEARTFLQGDGSVFERLERMPPAERPQWIVTYPGWWSKGFPLGKPRATAWLASTSITSGPDLTLYRFDSSALDTGRFPSRYLGDRGMYLPDENVPADPDAQLKARLKSDFWQVADEVDVADLVSEKNHGYRRIELPGQRPRDPEAWPRPWDRTEGLRADLPEPNPHASYVDIRKAEWSLTRDVPIQERLFNFYTERGSDLTTGTAHGTPPPSPELIAGAEALKRLDRITTPTFADLLDIMPPKLPSVPVKYDAGRSLPWREEFTLAAAPGAPSLLLWRTDGSTTRILHIQIDGDPLAPWTIPPATPGHWREAWLRLPPETGTASSGQPSAAVAASPQSSPRPPSADRKTLHIQVEYDPPGLPVTGTPLSAHWWLLQPAPPQ